MARHVRIVGWPSIPPSLVWSPVSMKHPISGQPGLLDQSLAGRLATRQKATAMVEAFGAPGVVLAGGLAQRMGGGDKPLREIGGHSILARVIARLEPQCESLLLSANGDPLRFASFGLPVIADGVSHHPGPLAGILAGLDWAAAHRPNAESILSAPGDCPFLPRDLVARLAPGRVRSRRGACRRRLARTISSCDRAVEGRVARCVARSPRCRRAP